MNTIFVFLWTWDCVKIFFSEDLGPLNNMAVEMVFGGGVVTLTIKTLILEIRSRCRVSEIRYDF